MPSVETRTEVDVLAAEAEVDGLPLGAEALAPCDTDWMDC